MGYGHLSLEEQVAQLFMVGYEGMALQPVTRRFLSLGVGGVIFFRDNFQTPPTESPRQPTLTASAIHALLHDVKAALPKHSPPPLLGIDQEGGQVERLPHTCFPTTVTPRAVALFPQPEQQARRVYRLMAQRLAALGFNLDFFPTLDVNLNPHNPVIGVRSFGDNPDAVGRLSCIAMDELHVAGLISVGKHFPGHGNGTVDSHLDLPTLNFTDTELQPFQQAIDAGLPVMMVAHGFYPALQHTPQEQSLPSSASPAVIQGLLRETCGFNGLVMTDDLNMGAITKHRSPIEAALAALRAGVDMLLYRRSTEEEWAVYEAVLEAFRSGALPMARLQESLARIAVLKARLSPEDVPAFHAPDWEAAACRAEADDIAWASVSILSGEASRLPLQPDAAVYLIHPDRSDLGNYAWDTDSSDALGVCFRQAGFGRVQDLAYPFRQALSVADQVEALSSTPPPDAIIFVAFNALLQPEQAALYQRVRERFPDVPIILVSAAAPEDAQVLNDAALHLALCSYRPASIRALARILREGFSKEGCIGDLQEISGRVR